MARGVTKRPRPGALRKIPFTWQTASDREAAHVLAQHNEWTERRRREPEGTPGTALVNPVTVSGMRVSSKTRIRGGVFAPKGNSSFV